MIIGLLRPVLGAKKILFHSWDVQTVWDPHGVCCALVVLHLEGESSYSSDAKCCASKTMTGAQGVRKR